MAMNVLDLSALDFARPFRHIARHNIESAVYFIWKTLSTRTIIVQDVDRGAWNVVRETCARGVLQE